MFLRARRLRIRIAKRLLEIYPKEKEGIIDKKFASLVNKKTCLQIAKNIELEKYILTFNPKNKKIKIEDKVLADCCEALVGAIYLDGGYKQCSKVIKELFKKKIENLDPNEDMRDSKTKLQEYIQQKGYKLPKYTLENSKTPKTKKIFKVICEIKELEISERGQGKNIKEAEMISAERTLTKILRQDEGE